MGVDAELQMRGLFDMYRWTAEAFASAAAVQTSNGKCGMEKDHAHIDGLIMQRGGYERLDAAIKKFRRQMQTELELVLSRNGRTIHSLKEGADEHFDWKCSMWDDDEESSITWGFGAQWQKSMESVMQDL